MATWTEFCELAGSFGAKQLNPTLWQFGVPARTEDHEHEVFASYEVMQPAFEFLSLKTALVRVSGVDCEQVLRSLGQLLVGAIGYQPMFDAGGNTIDGMLTLSTSIPLVGIDLSDPSWLLLYINVLGQAGDGLGKQMAISG